MAVSKVKSKVKSLTKQKVSVKNGLLGLLGASVLTAGALGYSKLKTNKKNDTSKTVTIDIKDTLINKELIEKLNKKIEEQEKNINENSNKIKSLTESIELLNKENNENYNNLNNKVSNIKSNLVKKGILQF